MGSYDSNGIWIYDENEDAAPFSTMLNRLGESVSDVVEPLVIDSGWVNLDIASGWTAQSGRPPQARYWRGEVIYRGQATHAGVSGSVVVATIPDGSGIPGPPFMWDQDIMWYSSSGWCGRYVSQLGQVGARFMTDATQFYFNGLRYPVD